MRLGLRTKLLGVTWVLLGALTAGALLTVRHYFGEQLQRQAEKQLQIGSHVLVSIMERSGSQLQGRGQAFRDLPSLKAALTKERNALEPLLLETKAIRVANLIWATDPKGIVLASTGEYPAVGKDLSQEPFIAAALNGQETLGFDLFGGQWWLILSLPVGGTTGNPLLGTVTLALLIGEPYMDRLEELTKCPVGFLWAEHQIWSKGWPVGIRQRIADIASRGLTEIPQEISLAQEGRYLWLSRTITGGEPPIIAGPIALLGASIDESVIRRTTQLIGWIAFSTMGIGALLLIGAIRSITHPLKLLVEDTQRIGAGDFSHRSRIQGEDEISEMADSFNQMVDRLEDSYRELEKLNRTLEERVKERTRELEEAQTQLLQAERLASIGQLSAGVAHELNNPLMVIMGNVQMSLREMKRGTQGPKELLSQVEEALKEIDQESQRAKTIINNLLNFARVTAPTRIETDIHPILDESVNLVSHQADLHSVEVLKRYAPHLPSVKVDPGQIKQVFVNVILNAVQAMPVGGKLTLETGLSGAYVKTVVQDTGVGISSEDLQKVFDPFYTTKEVGVGTGLGLSLSYSTIQNHQGMINLISKVGQGTTVTILLPLTQPA